MKKTLYFLAFFAIVASLATGCKNSQSQAENSVYKSANSTLTLKDDGKTIWEYSYGDNSEGMAGLTKYVVSGNYKIVNDMISITFSKVMCSNYYFGNKLNEYEIKNIKTEDLSTTYKRINDGKYIISANSESSSDYMIKEGEKIGDNSIVAITPAYLMNDFSNANSYNHTYINQARINTGMDKARFISRIRLYVLLGNLQAYAVSINSSMCEDFDLTTSGDKSIKINYRGFSTELKIKVAASNDTFGKSITYSESKGLSIKKNESIQLSNYTFKYKDSIYEEKKFNLADSEVKLFNKSGTQLTTIDSSRVGNQSVWVEYKGYRQEINYYVYSKLTFQNIATNPYPMTIENNSPLMNNNIVVNYDYAQKTIDHDDLVVAEVDTTKGGPQIFQVQFEGKSQKFGTYILDTDHNPLTSHRGSMDYLRGLTHKTNQPFNYSDIVINSFSWSSDQSTKIPVALSYENIRFIPNLDTDGLSTTMMYSYKGTDSYIIYSTCD